MGWSRGLRCNQSPPLLSGLHLKVDLVLELDFKVFEWGVPRERPDVVRGSCGAVWPSSFTVGGSSWGGLSEKQSAVSVF